MPTHLTRPTRPLDVTPDGVPTRIEDFLAANEHLPTPYLVLDLEIVRERYRELRAALPMAGIYYAVKANPDPAVLQLLADLGANFDVASIGEIELCLERGIGAVRLSYGNTIKKERDVATAHALGVRRFAVDAEPELDKIVRSAPGSTALIRIACTGLGADWPLSRKFGAAYPQAVALALAAADQGLQVGVSFHVGSQQRDTGAWERPLADVAALALELERAGHRLAAVNLGGGLPSGHLPAPPPTAEYGAAITAALAGHGFDADAEMMVEPGRFLVGDAGVLRSEVVLISDREQRWVYLDVGVFNGLVETQDEAIRYRLRCPGTSGPEVPAVLAGPTCDSLDVLYEREPALLPTDLRIGAPVDLLATGAYTTSYSSVNFNGFEPLRAYYLPVAD